MKKQLIKYCALICGGLILTSCSNEASQETTNTLVDSTRAKDSTQMIAEEKTIADPQVEKLLAFFTESDVFPFSIGSKELETIEGGKELKAAEVMLLTKTLKSNDPYFDASYCLENFYKIDSLKRAKKYDAYAESLDIGQMKESRCKALGRIALTKNDQILFWMNDYSTYEACPYAWGKIVFASAVCKGKMGETIIFAEHSGGADAPVSSETKTKGTLNENGTLLLVRIDENDQGEGETEINESKSELNLKEGVYTYTKEEKKKPRKRKNKTN